LKDINETAPLEGPQATAPQLTEGLEGVIQIGCVVHRDEAGNIVRREVRPGQMQMSGADVFGMDTPEGLLLLQQWCLQFAAEAGVSAVGLVRQMQLQAAVAGPRIQGYGKNGRPL
jgi:hypothetical protein